MKILNVISRERCYKLDNNFYIEFEPGKYTFTTVIVASMHTGIFGPMDYINTRFEDIYG